MHTLIKTVAHEFTSFDVQKWLPVALVCVQQKLCTKICRHVMYSALYLVLVELVYGRSWREPAPWALAFATVMGQKLMNRKFTCATCSIARSDPCTVCTSMTTPGLEVILKARLGTKQPIPLACQE